MSELRVLVVDDEVGIRRGARRTLQRAAVTQPDIDGEIRFECQEAEHLAAAREIIAAGGVDLLLLDYKLPDGTGLELLDWIKSRERPPLVVMITAYASLEMAVSTTKKGAWDFLAKPFTPDELRSVAGKAARHLLLERKARQLAAERRHVRFEFISVLAHELKAPLAVIESYLELIRNPEAGLQQDRRDQILGRCVERIGGMRKLIFDLLDLTRIESGQKKRELQAIDLVTCCESALEAIRPLAAKQDLALESDTPESHLLHADAGEIDILLSNLLSNAVKYNRPGGRITLRLKGGPGEALIEVEDTGIGMSPEEQAKLFGEFVRIHNEKTRGISGSGLGLSILKRLSALYHGNVTVRSEAGVGSTFSLLLRDANTDESAA